MTPLWQELTACIEFGVTYSEWLRQPPEHRALMLTFTGIKSKMESVEHQDLRDRMRREK